MGDFADRRRADSARVRWTSLGELRWTRLPEPGWTSLPELSPQPAPKRVDQLGRTQVDLIPRSVTGVRGVRSRLDLGGVRRGQQVWDFQCLFRVIESGAGDVPACCADSRSCFVAIGHNPLHEWSPRRTPFCGVGSTTSGSANLPSASRTFDTGWKEESDDT